MTAADIIAAHKHVPGVTFDMCASTECEWTGPGRASHAEHILAALKAGGYEVVQLPEPSSLIGSTPCWGRPDFRISVAVQHGGIDLRSVGGRLAIAEARSLAAALLAAARAAQEEKPT